MVLQRSRAEVALEILDRTVAKGQTLDHDEFGMAIRAAAAVFPGGEDSFIRTCTHEFDVSAGIVGRWCQGRSVPAGSMRLNVLERIRVILAAV